MKKPFKRLLLAIFAVTICIIAVCLTACITDNDKLTVTFDSSHKVMEGATLDSLKPYLTVKYVDNNGNESEVTDYTLSGLLKEGKCTIKVQYKEMTTTLTITVIPYTTTEGLAYTLNEDEKTYSVSKGAATDTDIVISSTYDEKPVVGIASHAFENCNAITSVTIPDSIMSIGEYSFSGCSALTSVTIGNGIANIGSFAFSGCNKLANINYLGAIETWCNIQGLYDLMQYGTSNKTFSLNGESVTEIVIPNTVTSIPSHAFRYCTNLTSVTIGNGITNIGYDAFFGCNKLANINYFGTIDSWCVIAGFNNLMDCYQASSKTLVIDGLEVKGNLEIPNTVTSISAHAFGNCKNISKITIPDSVTNIGPAVFSGCNSLEEITVSGGNTKYHSNGNCLIETESKVLVAGCKNSAIPTDGSVTSIGNSAFYNLSTLESITIPDNVTSISTYAFDGCDKLASINYLGTIESWCKIDGLYFLMGCGIDDKTLSLKGKAETKLFIPNSVTSIAPYAFTGTNISSVTIPDSITSVDQYAFYRCDFLTNITIPASVTNIPYQSILLCDKLVNINYLGTIESWCKIDGISHLMINNGKDQSKTFSINGNPVTELVIPNTVTSIPYGAFYRCSNIKSIVLPNSVTSIGGNAFSWCNNIESINYLGTIESWCNIQGLGNLMNYGTSSKSFSLNGTTITELAIPDTLTSIPYNAFCNCSSIKVITILDSVSSIGDNAFSGCNSLTNVTIGNGVTSIGENAFSNCNKLENIIIPNGITNINRMTFYGCSSLTSVTITDSVTDIGYFAFVDCWKLESITFTGTVKQWNNVTKDNNWINSNNVPATKVTCSDGEVAL